MSKLVFAAAPGAGLSMIDAGPAAAQGRGGAGGMCAPPGAAGQQQAMPGMPMPRPAQARRDTGTRSTRG